MKNLLDNNRMVAFMTIAILAVGSISIMGTNHVVMADQIAKVCIIVARDSSTNLGSGSNDDGNSNDGSNTATLIVRKQTFCPQSPNCADPKTFPLTISGNNPSPSNVEDDGTGTEVTIGPGHYIVSEGKSATFSPSFSGDCQQNPSPNANSAGGDINAGETQTCNVINTEIR